jgi:hypothetical protein
MTPAVLSEKPRAITQADARRMAVALRSQERFEAYKRGEIEAYTWEEAEARMDEFMESLQQ